MGTTPAWVPTLLRVRQNDVKAYTGWSLATALVLHLGPRPTARVLQALGELEQHARSEARQTDGAGLGRKQFLRLIGGAAAAAGLVATAQSPALAQSPHARASAWVEANLDRLPRTYAGIASRPVAYRKAIHRVLTPQERSQVWADHFRWYRRTHPNLTAAQDRVVDDAIAVASRGFSRGPVSMWNSATWSSRPRPPSDSRKPGRSWRCSGPRTRRTPWPTAPVPRKVSTARGCTTAAHGSGARSYRTTVGRPGTTTATAPATEPRGQIQHCQDERKTPGRSPRRWRPGRIRPPRARPKVSEPLREIGS